ncbi:TetR family transcriptional regulator [Actinomadura atramentaria]|uniref:TetR family transcriptional regulator n=1 Tax=Actinomadura atramentaria TaxID=1990 RepID=UPI00037D1E89|nr:TetR family transcriptional regulator [Actinomadura atramentaria]
MTAIAPETRPGDLQRPPGRRERKKQRTREALIDAAFTLFAAKGYDATTVEEIADAVDVSSRTFFRYFASKEDVALTLQAEQQEMMLAALAERPAHEPIMTALRNAVVAVTRAYECGDTGAGRERFRLLLRMLGDGGGLRAGSLEHAQSALRDTAAVIARRMDVDPAADLRPHVVAATALGAFHAALVAVGERPMGYSTLSAALADAFEIISAGFDAPRSAP